jgi:mono/diheme cytochrome c family protein
VPQLLAGALNILEANCGVCHGPPLTEAQASGGINYIEDWDKLKQAGLIEECSPEGSRIIEVMRTGEMPPPGSGLQQLSDPEVDVVAQAVVFDCEYDL